MHIFTDGSSRGNPGPGGWGAILLTDKDVIELGGREDHTTNNRIELMAAIRALEKASGDITVHSDSKYVIQGITEWVSNWKRNGWKTAGRKSVVNQGLWEELDTLASSLKVRWVHVEGHSGHPGNERCDEIATSFADGEDAHLYSGPKAKYPIDLGAR
jgi:ribonuclease HI